MGFFEGIEEVIKKSNISILPPGSLPEIQFNNGRLNDTTLVISNGNSEISTPSILTYQANDSTLSVRSRAQSTMTTCKRNSRRSAFVLDPMRTSMFRSKSLTDLNHSLVRTDKPYHSEHLDKSVDCYPNNLTINNNSIVENFNSTLNVSKSGSESIALHNSLENSYSGVIWQCADMIYEEFKNKYEELRWLMVRHLVVI